MGPKSIAVCLQSNARGLILAPRGQNSTPRFTNSNLRGPESSLRVQNRLKMPKLYSVDQNQPVDAQINTHAKFGINMANFAYVTFEISLSDKVLVNNSSPLGSRVSHKTKCEARGLIMLLQIMLLSAHSANYG